jgi:hypothetical protein
MQMKYSVKKCNNGLTPYIHDPDRPKTLVCLLYDAIRIHIYVQTGSGAHPASYPTSTGDDFPGSKAVGARSLPLASI